MPFRSSPSTSSARSVVRCRETASSSSTSVFSREATGEPFSPDYAMLARACGAEGIRVTAPSELDDALATAIRSDRPTVVDVTVDVAAPIATGTWQLPPLEHPEPNYPALVAAPRARG